MRAKKTLLALCTAAAVLGSAAQVAARPPSLAGRYRWNNGESAGMASDGIVIKAVLQDGRAQWVVSQAPGGAGQMGTRLTEKEGGGLEGTPILDAPSSRNIHIAIDPEVGKTRYAGLVFRKPCVLAIAADGTLSANKAGVAAGDSKGRLWMSRTVTFRRKKAHLFFRR